MFDDFDLFEQPEEFIPFYEEEDFEYGGINSVIATMSLIQTLQERRKKRIEKEKKITNWFFKKNII